MTGANSGIGLALCKQLAQDHQPCHIYLGSRSSERGEAAVEQVKAVAPGAAVELCVIDVASDASVASAAAALRASLGGETLYAIVNNAGTGLKHKGVTDLDTVNVNLRGPKRVCDAFVSMLASIEHDLLRVTQEHRDLELTAWLESKEVDGYTMTGVLPVLLVQ